MKAISKYIKWIALGIGFSVGTALLVFWGLREHEPTAAVSPGQNAQQGNLSETDQTKKAEELKEQQERIAQSIAEQQARLRQTQQIHTQAVTDVQRTLRTIEDINRINQMNQQTQRQMRTTP